MKKLDLLFIKMKRLQDNNEVRSYEAQSGTCKGIATYYKQSQKYEYEGDDLRKFNSFVEKAVVGSVLAGKDLPEEFVHGVG